MPDVPIINISPNPADGFVNIDIEQNNNNCSIVLTDILGNKVCEIYSGLLSPGNRQFQYPTDELKSGIYFVNFVSGQFIKTEKVVILK